MRIIIPFHHRADAFELEVSEFVELEMPVPLSRCHPTLWKYRGQNIPVSLRRNRIAQFPGQFYLFRNSFSGRVSIVHETLN